MAEPRIQYAKASDGVNIAFYAMGEGPPVILMPWIPFSHLEKEWQYDQFRRYVHEPYIQRFALIRYDHRGCGLSDREVTDHSLAAYLLDLEAVVDRTDLEGFALVARGASAPVAISYAAQNPERVSSLVLAPSSYARGSSFFTEQAQRVWELMQVDWELFTETLAHFSAGWSRGEEARKAASYFRDCATPEESMAAYQSIRGFDVSDLLSQIRAPTLIVHNREFQFPDVGVAKGLAASIPNARLVIAEDTESAVGAAVQFLDEVEEKGAAVEAPVPGTFRTVLFTDLVGHTEMMQRLGDAKGREVLRDHERITRDVLKVHGGTEVKTMGDGFMASFSSVTKAVECAIALQRAFPEREGEPLSIRVGLNAGEPIEEDGDLFGATVILASRIAAKAGGGEILVPETVRVLCSGKGFLFADRGEFVAKGFEGPVRIYEVSWRD